MTIWLHAPGGSSTIPHDLLPGTSPFDPFSSPMVYILAGPGGDCHLIIGVADSPSFDIWRIRV
ncbi:MAG: hypothetical protein HYX75_06220 [Acidobacteria bacterium]|nr:hypothetical protein [Acidobacteriota bacterium]